VLPYADRVVEEGSLGRGRSLASPQFAGDDGAGSPLVRHLLSSGADGLAVARALREERLLAGVVAVLDELDEAGGDKDSHMAVVSMVNDRGEKGLLAFTGVDSMAAWDPQARPVPSLGRDIARSAMDDGATAVVVDVAGPQSMVIAGAALEAMADLLDLARVTALVTAALAPLTSDGWAAVEVFDARPMDAGVDVIVQVTAPAGGHPDGRLLTDLARQAAQVISARVDIHRLVPGGLGVTAAP
jgi:SseB protein N-terminal domain